MEHHKLYGIKINVFKSLKNLAIESANKKQIYVALNSKKILAANKNKHLMQIINHNIAYCDGFVPAFFLKLKGVNEVKKIPGCELWIEIIKIYSKKKTFYFIGGTKNTIIALEKLLKSQFEKINALGFKSGFFNDEEKQNIISDIEAKKPDFIFVAMGSPKQEFLMSELQKIHKASYVGLGGSFDIFIGNSSRAPKLWVDYNLEWMYRNLQEPKRIKDTLLTIVGLVLLIVNRILKRKND